VASLLFSEHVLQKLTTCVLAFFCPTRRPEASKARIRRGTIDPLCLEAIDANMGDWVEDPGVLEGEDVSWIDVTVPSEPTFMSDKVKDLDDCSDSTDDRGSDDMRGMDENDDL
jgi:hypothetical protein